jgi:hypothetical protein
MLGVEYFLRLKAAAIVAGGNAPGTNPVSDIAL